MGAAAVVLGASGYTGGEVLRLLARHPGVTPVAAAAASWSGKAVGEAHPHLGGAVDLELVPIEDALGVGDVCFSCLPHGTFPQYAERVEAPVVVDLGDDFRADDSWSYGLPELAPPAGPRIANPGCYPTATLLCLVPFARAGLIGGPVIVDALSGVSGAGRSAQDHLMFTSVSGGAAAYGPLPHRHTAEMERGLDAFGGLHAPVSFTPHLAPMSRGLLVTARAPLTRACSDEGALAVLSDAYAGEPFVDVTEEWPSTKHVAGTNRAAVSARVDGRAGLLVCSAAIDNLGKGAAGQAVQNANLALGLDQTTGLDGIAVWP
jgi:N-acetyl-gamma-glutamyl-phosphate reductase